MKKWYKECPFCKEEIKREAIKCQFCKEMLPNEEIEDEKDTKICPFCWEKIKSSAKKCRYCKEFLSDKSYSGNDENDVKQENIKIESDIKEEITINSKEIKLCINIGNKRKKWWWFSIVWVIWLLVFAFSALSLKWTKEYDEATRSVWIIVFFLIIALIYYFIWLIKNYRALIKSWKKWLTFNSSILLVLGWICPIFHLFKPQQTLEDMLNFYHDDKENNKKNINIRWIFWKISLISFFLMFFKPAWLSLIAIITFVISHIIHTFLLIWIIDKIIIWQKNAIKQEE